MSKTPVRRVVSADPGLMSPQQLLASHKNGRRRTLEQLIAKNKEHDLNRTASFLAILKEKTRWFLENARVKISYDDFMLLVTLFVLFSEDVRIISLPPSSDHAFAVLNSIGFFLFVIEIVLHCWVKSDFLQGMFKVKGYMFSFFFWLDLLAIFSMIPDIGWLASLLGLDRLPGASVGAKVGKAGKIGAKTGRVVRMARLVRLVKLYKIASQRRRERKLAMDVQRLVDNGHIDQDDTCQLFEKMSMQKQSKVGVELSDIITRKVIVAVLLMLCVVPLLSFSPKLDNEKEATNFLHSVNKRAGYGEKVDCDYLLSTTDEYKDFMADITETSHNRLKYLIKLKVLPDRCNSTTAINFSDDDVIESIREDSMVSVRTGPDIVDGLEYSVHAVFNLVPFVKEQALSGIYLTLFVIFMLVTLSMQFTGDAQKLVLAPIEAMMDMVKNVADDPLEDFDYHTQHRGESGDYETRVVQVAIQKITALLRVGFGVAGADIISANMAIRDGENSAVIEPMLPGKRMYAIFGFCGIHEFDLCTEKLEDEIMTFVNSIARIVHDEVTRWGGLCNKNLGNAFLMVWPIGEEGELTSISGRKRRSSNRSSLTGGGKLPVSPSAGLRSRTNSIRNLSVDLRRIPGMDILSDKALIGFLKVVVEINRDRNLLAYRFDERLCPQRKGSSIGLSEKEVFKIGDGFKIRMAFGLHAGWAIEGAVGSLQKVDATYLSPHVNMAARMQAASKQFGVSILMTERFHELMSPEAQEQCRKVDVVTVKGSTIPMPVYTYDTFQDQMFPELHPPKFCDLGLVEVLTQMAEEYDSQTLWKTDQDLVQLNRLVTPAFQKLFNEGLACYLSGNWTMARKLLEKADETMQANGDKRGDGPSRTLLSYMQAENWTVPADWKGCRPLTRK